jgi:two-component system sensor histidine kinase KdpD
MLERARAFQSASYSAAAAQAEVFRSAVLDALAHEFKTPLSTILTAAGGLRESSPPGPQQELGELIESETSRLAELTSRILRTSQLHQNEVKPSLQRVNVSNLVAGLVNQCSRQWTDRKFYVSKETMSTEVFGDANLLELAIKQLLDNACKYSPPDSEVEVSVESAEEEAAIRVLNHGTTIRKDERARIFERLYRSSDNRHLVPGSGLGLYFAQEIVRAHGGSMELEEATSRSGKATTFRLTLPLAQSEC